MGVNKMNILLINPLYRIHQQPWWFPSGMGYIARSLLDEGHNVKILEANAHQYRKEQVKDLINKSEFDAVGISALVTRYSFIKWVAPIIKKKNRSAKIIVGDSAASTIPELLLNNTEVDILCIGEGDITIKEIMKSIEGLKDLKSVDGICYKDDGEVIKTEDREPIKNVDDIPFPAYELFPMDIYLKGTFQDFAIIRNAPKRHLSIITARGCPYRCTFCHRNIGGKVRLRSPENIIEEIKLLKEKYKIQGLVFNDELTIISKRRMYDLCDKLEEEKIDIKWACSGRVNLVDEDLLKRMKDAGCIWITYGVESGNQEMLDRMKKQITVKQAKDAIMMTRKVGIDCAPSFIIGMPGENRETIKDTFELLKESGSTPPYTFFYAQPYPGTELYELAKEMGKIGDEESFIEKLNDAGDFIVNLTDFTDEELISLRDEIIFKLFMHYLSSNNRFLYSIHPNLAKFAYHTEKRGFIRAVKLSLLAVIKRKRIHQHINNQKYSHFKKEERR
jgi:radical SAM superfamily enzyme YgiQ (UPF0313 family)